MDYSVNVLQFAEARVIEIASLMNEITGSEKTKKKNCFQRLPHYMRRRAASQNPKRIPKNLRGSIVTPTAKAPSKGRKKKHKRRPKSVQEEYAGRSRPDSSWLETHIWHAKRFKMETLWGYRIPMHSNERKLGSSHASAAHRCMIQDLSYHCCIELKGSLISLLRNLSRLTDASSGHTFASEMFLDGSKEGHSFLYHPDSCPYKAIGPISFLWQPNLHNTCPSTIDYNLKVPSDTCHKLWIWCHPSFHDELIQVLIEIFDFTEQAKCITSVSEESLTITEAMGPSFDKTDENTNQSTFPCKLTFYKTAQHLKNEKVYISGDTRMMLCKNTLVRHRLLGPMSQHVLSQVLKLADVTDISSEVLHSIGSSAKKLKSDHLDATSSSQMQDVPLKLWWESYYSNETQKVLHDKKRRVLDFLQDAGFTPYVIPRSIIGLTVRDPRISSSQKKEHMNGFRGEVSSCYKDFGEVFSPEMADSPLWDEDIRNAVTTSKLPESKIQEERSKCVVTLDLGRRENRIPIIIIQQPGLNGFASGWDFIAPLGWSSEFWRSFERNGGQPAGLRDLHFVNLEAGRPSFPCSFPDTEAGSVYEEKVRLDSLTKYYKYPQSKRPNFSVLGISIPFFMCWRTLVSDWVKELQSQEVMSMLNSDSPLVFKDSHSSSQSSNNNKCNYFVLRKTEVGLMSRLSKHLYRIPTGGLSGQYLQKLTDDWHTLMESCLNSTPNFEYSLILSKLQCLNKGRPSTHAGVYLPSKADLEEVKKNRQFCGPSEPNHSIYRNDEATNKSRKKDLRKKMNILDRPQIGSLISNSARKMIGYISEGGYSSLCGRGYAIGHCSSIGFLILFKMCLNVQICPLVLIRDQHNSQYRFCRIEVIENYL